MENNISQSAKALSSTITNDIAIASSSNLKKHFSKVVLVIIALSIISYFIKFSNIFSKKDDKSIKVIRTEETKKNKVEEKKPAEEKPPVEENKPAEEKPPVEELKPNNDQEIKDTDNISYTKEELEVCKKFKCNPKDLVRVPKKKFDSMIECSLIDTFGRRNLKNFSTPAANGDRFFATELGIELYTKIITSSGYVADHELSKEEFANLVYVSPNNKLFDDIKESGYPAPGLKNGSILLKYPKFLDFLRDAAKVSGPNPRVSFLYSDTGAFEEFEEGIRKDKKKFIEEQSKLLKDNETVNTENFDYHVIGEFESRIYISYEFGAFSRCKWVSMSSIGI